MRVVARKHRIVAHDLHGGDREVVVELGTDELVDHRLDAGILAANLIGELSHRVQAERLDANLEVGEALAEDGVFGERASVAPGCAREGEQALQSLLAAGAGAEHVALMEQGGVGDDPSLVEFRDQVLARDADVIEEDFVEAAVAGHLDERAYGDAGRFHVDENVGDAAVLGRLGIGAHQAEHPVGVLCAGGPDFLAVDDEFIADDLGARAQ